MALERRKHGEIQKDYIKEQHGAKRVAKWGSYSNCGLELCFFPFTSPAEERISKWTFKRCIDLNMRYVARNMVMFFFSGPNNQPSVHSFAKWLKDDLKEEVVEGPVERREGGYWQRTYIWKPSDQFRSNLNNERRKNERQEDLSRGY